MFVTIKHRVFTCKTFFVTSKLQITFLRIINFSTFETISNLFYENKYSNSFRIRRWRIFLMFSTLKFRFSKSWRFLNDSIISAISIINRIDLWINKIVNDKTIFFKNSSFTIFKFFNFFLLYFLSISKLYLHESKIAISILRRKIFFCFDKFSTTISNYFRKRIKFAKSKSKSKLKSKVEVNDKRKKI